VTQTREAQDVSAERTRRAALCFQAEAPTEVELCAARQRYLRRRQARRRALPVGHLLCTAAGAAGALVVVAAYGRFGPHSETRVTIGPEVPETAAPAGPGSVVESTDVYFEKNGVRHGVHDGLRETLAAGETGTIMLGDSQTRLPGPGVVEFRRRTQAGRGWRVSFSRARAKAAQSTTDAKGARVPGRPASAQLPSAGSESGTWARVARALRDQDPTAAERALRQLIQEDDVETRQAAELALAQLQVAQGREEDAKTVLEKLSRSASAPIVRSRAADLLRQIE
jgi:hypothetical protein